MCPMSSMKPSKVYSIKNRAQKTQAVRVLNTAAKISYESLLRRIDQVSAAIAEQKAVQENHAWVV
jgi:hypothetical protein